MPCSTATARVAAELALPVSAKLRRAASSSNAVGHPVPRLRDDASPHRRACVSTWPLRASRRALGREPAARTGPARQDRGLRALCKPGHVGTVAVGCALLCKQAASGFSPLAVELFFLFSEYIQILVNSKICVGFI
jgi:hypothetical protein